MKKLVRSIALAALISVAICGTTQAYWHHGGGGSYWNYYRTFEPGRGNDEKSTRWPLRSFPT